MFGSHSRRMIRAINSSEKSFVFSRSSPGHRCRCWETALAHLWSGHTQLIYDYLLSGVCSLCNSCLTVSHGLLQFPLLVDARTTFFPHLPCLLRPLVVGDVLHESPSFLVLVLSPLFVIFVSFPVYSSYSFLFFFFYLWFPLLLLPFSDPVPCSLVAIQWLLFISQWVCINSFRICDMKWNYYVNRLAWVQ